MFTAVILPLLLCPIILKPACAGIPGLISMECNVPTQALPHLASSLTKIPDSDEKRIDGDTVAVA
jgi:hypothetical protein